MSIKAKNSLLLLTNQLNFINSNFKYFIQESFKYTKQNLYIYINPYLFDYSKTLFNDRYKLKLIINQFYQYSFKLNPDINVTCLLHNIHHEQRKANNFKLNYDLILTDFLNDSKLDQLDQFLKSYLPTTSENSPKYLTLSLPQTDHGSVVVSNSDDQSHDFDQIYKNKVYENSIVGGTFDRLHIGHKILFSESVLLTRNKFLIGVSDGELLIKKKLADFIEDFDERCKNVKEFMSLISPDLKVQTVRITDPFGPSITEPDYQCLIVSQETATGGELVNKKRLENNLSQLDIHIIGLVNEQILSEDEEPKVSSSNERKRLLGSLLREPYLAYDKSKPYVIGLTGGLASGKSNIVKDLEKLGCSSVDSDKLGHKAYEKDTECYKKVVETFGKEILDENGNINRKELGKKVFGRKEELKKLTDIVWPEIRRLRDIEIDNLFKQGHRIIVVEAAVMLEANWNQNVNEIWVVFVPEEEAIKRAMCRDGSSLEKVKQTLSSQLCNKQKLKHANVALCSLWEREYTIKQVNKAWDLLLKRTIEKN